MRVAKVVNLSGLPMFSGVHAKEQFCRHWLGTRLLVEFRGSQERLGGRSTPHVAAQYSRFVDSDDAYFNFGMALSQPLRPETAISLVVGFKADERLLKVIRFAKDPTIREMTVNSTCERCGLAANACADRAAAPLIFMREQARGNERQELDHLLRSRE